MKTTARVIVLCSLALIGGCDRPPTANGLKEWSAEDHDHSDESTATSPSAQPGRAKGAASSDDDNATLVEATWRQQCAACHGMTGRGDGPTGPMVKASDLTLADWQSKVTDSQMAETIKSGKGKMPKFELPEPVIAGLVRRIRAMKQK